MSALIKFIRPTEVTFHKWMRGFPFSGHPSDEERFYVFLRTAFAFGAKKWLRDDFVVEKIKQYHPMVSEDDLKRFRITKGVVLDFMAANPVQKGFTVGSSDFRVGRYQVEIINGELVETELKIL